MDDLRLDTDASSNQGWSPTVPWREPMTIEFLHGVLAVVFAVVWLLVWQIVCRSQRIESREVGDGTLGVSKPLPHQHQRL
jgi:hypothetical protein